MLRRYLTLPVLRDALWLLILGGYIFAGMTLTPFHGDEAMQIYMSHDYAAAFLRGMPGSLTVSPPYAVDSDPWLRLINGSVNRYAIGLSWQVAGLSENDLPGLWEWPLSYEDNAARDHRPSDALLNVSRLSSTFFLALSAAVMFAIGWHVGGRRLAYLTSGLYALNPVILLNGRRAMQEGSFLLFGLLAVMIAIIISRKRANGESDRWFWWLLLIVSGGLTLASKHSGIVLVGAAFGWIVLAEFIHVSPRGLAITGLRLAVSGFLVIALFIGLSPALWNDPAARLSDLITARRDLLDSQVKADPDGATPLMHRVEGIITQPFMTPPQHFEVAFWTSAIAVMDSIERYMASPFSGIQFESWIGGALTLLAGWGVVICLWPQRQRAFSTGTAVGILGWVGITVLSLLVNPLPWQRYYLAWYPVAALLAGIGLLAVWERLKRARQP